MTDVQLTHECW